MNIEEEIKRLEHQADIYTKNADDCLKKAHNLKAVGDATMPIKDILEMIDEYRQKDMKADDALTAMEKEILDLCQKTM